MVYFFKRQNGSHNNAIEASPGFYGHHTYNAYTHTHMPHIQTQTPKQVELQSHGHNHHHLLLSYPAGALLEMFMNP